MDYSEIWWETISGPSRFTADAAQALREGSHVLLLVPESVPYPEQMRYSIEEKISGSYTVDYFEPFGGNRGFFEELLERYQTAGAGRKFRPGITEPISFLKENGILENRALWVKGTEPETEGEIVDFIHDYARVGKKIRSTGVIAAELTERNSDGSEEHRKFRTLPSNVKILRYQQYLSPYDSLLFADMAAAGKYWRNLKLAHYSANVAACLCGGNGEQCAELIEEYDVEKDEPAEVYERISGGRPADASELWKAQLQVLFPLIEVERAGIAERRREEIAACLPARDMFGNTVSRPEEAELGVLKYLLARQDTEGERKLTLPDRNEVKRICLLSDLRNKLAHRIICTREEVMEILQDGTGEA